MDLHLEGGDVQRREQRRRGLHVHVRIGETMWRPDMKAMTIESCQHQCTAFWPSPSFGDDDLAETSLSETLRRLDEVQLRSARCLRLNSASTASVPNKIDCLISIGMEPLRAFPPMGRRNGRAHCECVRSGSVKFTIITIRKTPARDSSWRWLPTTQLMLIRTGSVMADVGLEVTLRRMTAWDADSLVATFSGFVDARAPNYEHLQRAPDDTLVTDSIDITVGRRGSFQFHEGSSRRDRARSRRSVLPSQRWCRYNGRTVTQLLMGRTTMTGPRGRQVS